MLYRKKTRAMNSERFERWFEEFKAPYAQKKFIHSYKSLENSYSELVIQHLLSFQQKAKVHHFIRSLPKMSPRRFHHFLEKLKKDGSIIHKYSYKDFTRQQQLIVNIYLFRDYLKQNIF